MKKTSWCPYCMSPIVPGEVCPVCGLTEGSYTAQPHHLPPGTVLRNRYLIGRVLGEGGFGITYIGCDLQLEVRLAIKEYFPVSRVSRNTAAGLTISHYTGTAGSTFEHDLSRFLREARAMAKLSKQPNIVTVHDFFEENGTAYIVMEYIDGTTFRDLVSQRGGKIPAWELLHLLEPLFFALQTMHEAGLIHRDISPENIMLENGVVRLLDFGCARSLDNEQSTALVLKTGYAPPEQYQGKGQGPWTDVYALAATIYYCLTGVKPPQAMDRMDIFLQDEDPLVPPRNLGAELTRAQEQALLHALQIHRRHRYQSMQEFHAALYEGIDSMSVHTGTAGTGSGSRTEEEPDSVQQAEIPGPAENKTAAAQAESGRGFSARSRRRKLAAGIAAALAGIALIAGIAVGLQSGSGSSTEESEAEDTVLAEHTDDDTGSGENTGGTAEGTTGSDSAALSDEAAETGYTIIDGTAYVQNGLESSLRAALADDAAESVIVTWRDLELTEGILYVSKPLTLETDLWTYDAVIVEEGGELIISSAGYASFNALIATRDGGSITVQSGSAIGSGGCSRILYLESWDDLTLEQGATFDLVDNTGDEGSSLPAGTNGNIAFAIDEDVLFADSYAASSEEALRAAMKDDSVSAITITGDITLTEDLTQTKPVRILEGVTVTALGAEQALSEDGETVIAADDSEEQTYCGWNVSGSVLFNHGTLRGEVNTADPDGTTNSGDEPYIINDGTLTMSGSMCRGGCLVNLEEGTLNYMYGDTNCNIVNLGTFLCASTVSGETALELTDPGFAFLNSGTLLVETTQEQPAEQTIDFTALSAEFDNCSGGSILLGENANAVLYASFTNHGSITLTHSSAVLTNERYLSLASESTLDVRTGQFADNGVVQYISEASFLSSEAPQGHWFSGKAGAGTDCSDNVAWVDSTQELEAALNSGSTRVICLTDAVSWEGDLTLNGQTLISDALITITDGDLILTGSDTAVELTGVNMNGGNILLTDGATLLLHEYQGAAYGVGTLEITDGALLLATGGTSFSDMQIVVEGTADRTSGLLGVAESLELYGCDVQIGAYGILGGAETDEATAITVLEGGTVSFELYAADLAGSIDNAGTLAFCRDFTVGSTGIITNTGLIRVGSMSLCVQGTLQNQGEITVADGGGIFAEGGTIIGYTAE